MTIPPEPLTRAAAKSRVLVVAAHPDDEVLGCGGTMARLAREGHEVFLAIAGEGITSRYDRRQEADGNRVAALRGDAQRVATFLGARDLSLLGLPDNRFDTVPLLDVVKMVEAIIAKVSPTVVYTHHAGDLNVDHEVLNRAVMTATRPVPGERVLELYAFAVASSTEWAFHRADPTFRPNVFVDITATLETKVEAMALYESEARPAPHPRASETIRATARHWGSAAGCHAAEPFQLIRAIR